MKLTIDNILTVINTILVLVLFYLNRRNERINVAPYISVELDHDGETPILILANEGNVFAMDVDIYALGFVRADKDKEVMEELCSKLKEANRAMNRLRSKTGKADLYNLPEPDEEGWIGVYDRLVYAVIAKKRVTAKIAMPKKIWQVTVVLQYRDPRGVNYSQEYGFARWSNGSFRLEDLSPNRLRTALRRDYITGNNLRDSIWPKNWRAFKRLYTYKAIWGWILVRIKPWYMTKHTHKMILKHAVSSGYWTKFSGDFELSDRGQSEALS